MFHCILFEKVFPPPNPQELAFLRSKQVVTLQTPAEVAIKAPGPIIPCHSRIMPSRVSLFPCRLSQSTGGSRCHLWQSCSVTLWQLSLAPIIHVWPSVRPADKTSLKLKDWKTMQVYLQEHCHKSLLDYLRAATKGEGLMGVFKGTNLNCLNSWGIFAMWEIILFLFFRTSKDKWNYRNRMSIWLIFLK